jgi:glycogen debranching enzyme
MTETLTRPTPEQPWPGGPRDDLPSPWGRSLPPELGPNALAVLEGVSFMYSDASGDVPAGSIGGLVHADTRLLSKWVLTINGAKLLSLGSGSVEHYSAAFFLTNPELPGLPANEFGIRRLRSVGNQFRERIEVWCFAREPEHLEIRLSAYSDFADLFEIKDIVRDRSDQIVRAHEPDGSALQFSYANEGFSVQTRVEVSRPATRVEGDDLVWELELADDATWSVDVTVPFTSRPRWVMPAHQGFGESGGEEPYEDDATAQWYADVPTLESDSHVLCEIGRQTTRDLLALRVQANVDGHSVVLPAAGLPWFLTIFGRDTLLTAYQSVSYGPHLARGALLELASMQGKECNDFKDEEPGRIMHEIRQGELTLLGLKPHSPYYGTSDATMLWLILLSEYWRWTGDNALIRRLEPNARAALAWIDQYGDRDGDGYVEYQTRSRQGLGNQCWRDSWDGVQFADGRVPYLPIATCELQGYVYDAKLRLAELLDGPLRDPALAETLRTQAATLKQRFNEDFWIDDRGGYFAVGLDGDKQRIDSLTSNNGHLLWSGIVAEERAPFLVRQLMSNEMFSGWGVRTMATTDRGYNPIGYHTGTVWPHDNSLIVMGLTRYGYREEANRIVSAQIEAASYTGHRLPENFCGYARSVSRFPVPYATACSPQAWATAAPMLFLRCMLGLDAHNGELTVDPVIPAEYGRVAINGVNAFGVRWDIEAVGRTGTVRRAPRR